MTGLAFGGRTPVVRQRSQLSPLSFKNPSSEAPARYRSETTAASGGGRYGAHVVSCSRQLARAAQSVIPRTVGGVYILAYHLVEGGTDLPVDVRQAVFRRQMLDLRELAEVVPLHRAIAELKSGARFHHPMVVVTFDDAYENFFSTAWPLLYELSFPVTLFVPVGFVEGRSAPPLTSTGHMPPVSWSQLAEMLATGLLSVGAHGWGHCDLRSLSPARARDDLRRSRDMLEDRLEQCVDTFCYPRGLWSRPVERQVATVYGLATIGGGRRLTAANWNPLRLWRIPLRRDRPKDLQALLASAVWLEEWLADKARRYLR